MARYLGVYIERTARSYSEVIQVGHGRTGTKRLTTIVPGQRVAEIQLFLLHPRRHAARKFDPKRKLHTFSIPIEYDEDTEKPLFDLKIDRRRGRRYTATVLQDGRPRDSAEIRVPLTAFGVLWRILVVALLFLGVWWGLNWARSSVEPIETGESTSPGTEQTVEERDDPDQEITSTVESASQPRSGTGAHGSDNRNRDADIDGGGGIDGDDSTDEDTQSDAPTAPQPTAQTDSQPTNAPPVDTPEETPITPHSRLETTVYFGPDSIQLTPQGRRTLDALVTDLATSEVVSIQIEGHTALYGNEAGREMISQGRIDAVARYLRPIDLFDADEATYRIVGALEPVTRETAQQQLNRRSEIIVTYRRDER